MQDQVTSNVVATILPYVERAEIARTRDKPTASLVAYDHYLRGLDCGAQFTRQSNEEALGHYQRAIAEDPKYALAYVRAAICLLNRRAQGWLTGDPALEAAEAMRLARKALTFDRADPQVLANAASVFQYLGGNYDEGEGLVRLSVELNPNYFSGWNIRGWIALGSGDRGAYEYFQQAIRLSPRHPRRFNIQAGLAAAEFFRGNYEEAVKLTTTALLQRPNYLVAMWVQAAALALLGRSDEASASCRSILEIVPNARVSMLDNWVVSKRPEILDTFREGLRRSGIPE